jgi:hypothetical protein
VVNEQMSTFILALFEILSGIRYFGVVLLVILVMFGDMLHIVSGNGSKSPKIFSALESAQEIANSALLHINRLCQRKTMETFAI